MSWAGITTRTLYNSIAFGASVNLGSSSNDRTLTFAGNRNLAVSFPVVYTGVISSTAPLGPAKSGTSSLLPSTTNTYFYGATSSLSVMDRMTW